jgi:hypothetical protein
MVEEGVKIWEYDKEPAPECCGDLKLKNGSR